MKLKKWFIPVQLPPGKEIRRLQNNSDLVVFQLDSIVM